MRAFATNGAAIKIVIADDHPLFRGAMRQALNDWNFGVERTGETRPRIFEAGDFDAVLDLLEKQADIDLILLDLAMPGTEGFTGLINLLAQHASVPVVIVSATEDPATVRRALELGASGFIPKSASMETIREAIAAVLSGDEWKLPDMDLGAEHDGDIADLISRLRTLTPRQGRVLAMLSRGLLNKQIAYELGVSEATVKAHVSAVLQKLGVDSRTQAVVRMSRMGTEAITEIGIV